MVVCPLVFQPIYKRRIWGGRQLAALFNRSLPADGPIGESWEVADLEGDQSVARAGEQAKGKTLGRLTAEWGPKLLGQAELREGRFPLLIKYLDAREVLSVQVHPDAVTAKRLGGSVRAKNEAWYVVAAEADACIYRGLVPGVDRQAFTAAIKAGAVRETLRQIPVKAGQCYYLPGGTVHALGAGAVVAEIQTPSDVTYRVYDWDRADPTTGKGRELHVDRALQCIEFRQQEYPQEKRSHVASVWTSVTRLITCDSFLVERVRMTAGIDRPIPYDELVIWMVLQGRGQIGHGRNVNVEFGPGDTVVLPAGLDESRVITREDCVWLEVTLPAGRCS